MSKGREPPPPYESIPSVSSAIPTYSESFVKAAVNNHQWHEKSVIIRHPKSGLVLDGSDYKVKLQHFVGSSAQKWKLECTCFGRFIIVCELNGKALDIEGGPEELSHIITYPKHGDTNQQWYINSDGTIECPCEALVLDVDMFKYKPGTQIIAYTKHGKMNQKFQIQYT